MENNPFNERQWSGSAESKDDKSDNKKDSASSKTALSLGKVAERPFFSRGEAAQEARQQTVWERLSGEAAKPAAASPEAPGDMAVEQETRPVEQLRQVISDHRESLAQEQADVQATDPEKIGAEAESLLLDNTDALSRSQPEVSPHAIINDAYEQTVSQVHEAFQSASPTEGTKLSAEDEAGEPAIAETNPLPLPEAGEAGGGNMPPEPPEQPTTPQGPEEPPDPRLYGAVSPSPAAPEAAPANPSEQNDWYYAGRRRGTIAGFAVGYFAGRRGGRKRAERRFSAERKKFEKHTAQLSAALEGKEQQIRRLTQNQVEQTPPQKYPEIVERLQTVTQRPAAESRPPTVERPAVPLPESKPTFAKNPVAETIAQPTAPAPAESLKQEPSRYAEVVPFTKTSAELSWRELKAIAEKIKVDDDVTLKDLYEAHRFDEKAFRRIVSVFLEGGDVRRAITHEVTEHDKNFERDPLLRQKSDSSTLSGGGKVEQAVVQSGAPAEQGGGTVTTPFKQIDGRPEPSPEALKALKQRQATSVAVVALLIIALILLVLALSR